MFISTRQEIFRPLITSELDYENLVLSIGELALPGWKLFRWKHRVYTPDGRGVEPDAVMLSTSSDEWCVVEIELAKHSISGHIDDQLDRMSSAVYGPHIATSLSAATKGRFEQIAQYLRRAPGFVCIADSLNTRLKDCCDSRGFDLVVLEPHRSDKGHGAVRVVTVPAHLRQEPGSAVTFLLRRSPESLLGAHNFLLPDSFPQLNTVYIGHLDATWVCRVVALKGARLLFGPPEFAELATGGVVLITPVDPGNGIFAIKKAGT